MKLRAITLLVTLTLSLCAAPLSTVAQQVGKVYHIGLLGWSTQSFYKPYIEVFLEELHDRGWVEGQHFILESRFADRKGNRLPGLVAELSRLELDVIVTITTTATKAAMQVIKTTPIVFTVVADPVPAALSIASPSQAATLRAHPV
jgi:putative ABC transport system substrate-binding protein